MTAAARARAGGGAAPLVLEIERLAAGGDGVAHAGGKVVFVPGTAPGDLLEAELERERPSFARARALRLLRRSRQRVEPPCPAFGRCGGCSWQHLGPGAQLEAKRAIVAEALRRVGRLEPPPIPPVTPSPRDYGYRHRARLHRAAGAGGPAFGFFRHGTHEVVPIGSCPVLVPALAALPARLAEAARRHPAALGRCAAVRMDADFAGEAVLLTAEDGAGRRLDPGPAAAAALRGGDGPSVAVWPERVELRLGPGPEALRTTGGAFTQVNLAQNEALVRAALELAAPTPGEEVLDLYCGLGNLGVPAARRGASVLGVDLDAGAVALAAANARRAGAAGARFLRGDAAGAVAELAAAGRAFGLVVLNPPRTGAREAVAALPRLGAGRVLYVSCDPATLARDAAVLDGAGYRLEAALPLDLFPQTPHVETVALLRRRLPCGSAGPAL